MADDVTAATMTAGAEPSPETPSLPSESPSPSEPQAADTPTQPQAASSSTEAPVLSPRDRLREALKDPEFKRTYEEEINRHAQRIADKRVRKAELSTAKDDPIRAQEIVQRDLQSLEAEETAHNETVARFRETETALADLWKNEAWRTEYETIRHEQESVKLYSQDPKKWLDWIDDRVTERIIEKRAEEKAKALTEARVLEETNRRLAALPVPPTGNAGGGGPFTLEQIRAMSPQEYTKHREAILASLAGR